MGDQPHSIDWRQSAKSDMVFVRQMEWEAAQSVWIWRDTSASMGWTSDRNHQSKRERADLLVLALSVLLMRGGEHVALLGSGLRPSASRSEEHTSELQSLMRISYAVFCLKKKKTTSIT